MTIIEQEATDFTTRYFTPYVIDSREFIKDKLEQKIYSYTRTKDQIEFLQATKTIATNNKTDLEAKLNGPSGSALYDYRHEIDLAIFAIDELLEGVYYEAGMPYNDGFTPNEANDLHNILNDILSQQKQTNAGQEVIFNELEELKAYISLGKKGFRQMATGKIAEMVAGGVIDKAIGNEIYNSVTSSFKEAVKLIDGL